MIQKRGDGFDADSGTHVGTLTVTTNEAITLNVTLTGDQLARVMNDEGLSHYYYYSSAASATTDAQIVAPVPLPEDVTLETLPLANGILTKIDVMDRADGNFGITVTVPTDTIDSDGTATNTALLDILTAANGTTAESTAAGGQGCCHNLGYRR